MSAVNCVLNAPERAALLDILWDRALVGEAMLDREGRFLHANPVFCQITEYSEPELQAMSFQDITHPADLAADVSQADEVSALDRESYVMKKRYLTKTGHVVWVVLAVNPMIIGGKFRMFVVQVSEVVTVHPGPVPVLVVTKPTLEPLLKLIRENYPWVILFLGSVAYTLAEVLKRV